MITFYLVRALAVGTTLHFTDARQKEGEQEEKNPVTNGHTCRFRHATQRRQAAALTINWHCSCSSNELRTATGKFKTHDPYYSDQNRAQRISAAGNIQRGFSIEVASSANVSTCTHTGYFIHVAHVSLCLKQRGNQMPMFNGRCQ